MKIAALFELFYEYLKNEKKVSPNTFQAYKSDLLCFHSYLIENDLSDLEVSPSDIESFKTDMKDKGRAVSSVSRCLSSVRALYTFLLKKGFVSENPARLVKNDKGEEKHIDILTADEIDTLIGQPVGSDEKSVRDRALLELLYATGLKVSEIISLDYTDFNATLSTIRCKSTAGLKDRVIPLYPRIKKLLSNYISFSRKFLVFDDDEMALFVNVNGSRMTRQGVWKLIKHYAESAGIKKEITPCTLRHSFATHLLENGADLSLLCDVLGHSDISSTNVYVNLLKNKSNDSLLKFHPHA